ncbi:MAG: hypothetical protein U0905_21520 [Pirellulales bacterium]
MVSVSPILRAGKSGDDLLALPLVVPLENWGEVADHVADSDRGGKGARMLRRRLRQGKISWVTSLATAGLVGAAGIVGTMTYQNGQSPESTPTHLSSAVTTDLPAESTRLLVDEEEQRSRERVLKSALT